MKVLSIAQDTDPGAPQDVIAELLGSEPTLPLAIDTAHRTSALFNLVNVPAAIWIDERGRIVRLDHGAFPGKRSFAGVEVGVDGYKEAIADWVARGDKSRFVRAPGALKDALAPRSPAAATAELHFRLGAFLARAGDEVGAEQHWERAQALAPENWNYHRQDWADSTFESSVWFLKKVITDDGPYYAPIELDSAVAAPAADDGAKAPPR